MTRKRKDKEAKIMYEEYQKGFSLEEVGKMFNITRQAVYSLMKLRKYKLRKKVILPYQFFNGKKYSLRNTGYYGLTNDDRRLIHRDVWMFYNKKDIPKNFDIHHIDRNKTNNKINNLELISHAEHSRKYSTGHNQFTKFKT